MDTVLLTLGNRSFVLSPETSTRRLERRLIAAMRRGAGVVRLPLADGGSLDALVSRALPVTLEHRATGEPGGTDGEAWWQAELPVDWPDCELERAF